MNCSSEIIESFELNKVVNWINSNNYSKVCLQFPDSLLGDSVSVCFHIEKETGNKVYVLGDTSYGSCCVDEVACNHVEGDAVVHFGHACLTKTARIPVFYVVPKKKLNLVDFYENLHPILKREPTLILFDTGFSHLRNEIIKAIPEEFNELVVSVLLTEEPTECGKFCSLSTYGRHSVERLSRGFCGEFKTVIYIGSDPAVESFLLLFKDILFYQYDSSLRLLESFRYYKKISFLTEKIKDAHKIGLIVGTLAVERYLDAISHVKKLCKRRKKRVYIISVGKPTVAKLSNFPEIDVFVLITCPETNYIDSKDCIQPIVGLLELELALNENRTWDKTSSKDFRDLLNGGSDFIEVPSEDPEDTNEVSLVGNKLQGIAKFEETTSELVAKPEMSLRLSDFSSRPRTWDGLELNIGDTEVQNASIGRSGTAQGYQAENELS